MTSWKSLMCVGLVCALAMPVMAQPTLSVDLVRSGGLPVLTAGGDWQWLVSVTPDAAMFTDPDDSPDRGTGGSVAIEVGFSATDAALVSAAKDATNFPSDNIGATPFGFGGDPDDGVTVSGNDLFAALGSDFFTAGTAQDALTIVTDGPSTAASLTSTLTWLGAYSGSGRLAQGGSNFDSAAGSLSKTAFAGDTDLDGDVDLDDVFSLSPNFGGAGIWSGGDFDGDNDVDLDGVFTLSPNFGQAQPGGAPGSGAAVPEPSTIVLLALAGLLLAVVRRK